MTALEGGLYGSTSMPSLPPSQMSPSLGSTPKSPGIARAEVGKPRLYSDLKLKFMGLNFGTSAFKGKSSYSAALINSTVALLYLQVCYPTSGNSQHSVMHCFKFPLLSTPELLSLPIL